MDVDTATVEGSVTVDEINGTRVLDTSNSGDGLRYQLIFNVTLPTGGFAEEVVIDAATTFRLRARHYTFNALESSAPETAVINSSFDSTGLLVTLPFPRLISSIVFANTVSDDGKDTQLFRTDGDVTSEDPVASYRNRSSASSGFIFDDSVKVNSNSEEFDFTQETSGDGSQVKKTIVQNANHEVRALPKGNFDGTTDAQILVQLKGTNNTQLSNNSLHAFNVTTGPENLRVGVRIGELGNDFFYLPLQFELDSYTDAQGIFADQIKDVIARYVDILSSSADAEPLTLPDEITLQFAVESDAPCRFTIDDFVLRYRLVRKRFSNGKNKEVLRFSGQKLDPRQVSIDIPPSVVLYSSELKIAGDENILPSTDVTDSDTPPLSDLLLQSNEDGLKVDTTTQWSTRSTLSVPTLLRGWDILVAGLEPDTQLELTLITDNNGGPQGELLAKASAQISHSRHTVLLRFLLESPKIVQPGIYWLTLSCPDGAAVWYAESDPDGSSVQWKNHQHSSAQHTLTGTFNWATTIAQSTDSQHAPSVIIEEQALALNTGEGDWNFDLNPVIGPVTPAGTELIDTKIQILSPHKSPLTVYAPRIEYEL